MEITKIRLCDIEVDENQPRKDIVNVGELAMSIRKEGLMQPIEVRKLQSGKYKIIDGERRYFACKLLKKTDIDCVVFSGEGDVFIRQLVSDFHKERLNLVEQADAIKNLQKSGMDYNDIKQQLGISKSKMYLLKKIVSFNLNTRKLITEGKLTQNILANISNSEITKDKEDEIIRTILEKRAKTEPQINSIVMRITDVRWNVNNFLTTQFRFEKLLVEFLNYVEKEKKGFDSTIKEEIKSNKEEIISRIEALRDRLNLLLKIYGKVDL